MPTSPAAQEMPRPTMTEAEWSALGEDELGELVCGEYIRVIGASEGTLDVPGCAGLTLDLSALWRYVDELPDAEEP